MCYVFICKEIKGIHTTKNTVFSLLFKVSRRKIGSRTCCNIQTFTKVILGGTVHPSHINKTILKWKEKNNTVSWKKKVKKDL